MPDHVVNFPPTQLDPEEAVRRQHAEAQRLSRLAPGEYPLSIDRSAAQLGVSRAILEASVKALIAEREKQAQQARCEQDRVDKAAERKRQEKRKQKAREFKVLAELPEREQESRLEELAKRLEEDPVVVREEFAASPLPPIDSGPELWPEAVAAVDLLDDLAKLVRRYVVIRIEELTAAVLFTAMCWIHDSVATHSPILGVTSPDIDSGKTTLLGALALLVPKPFRSAELTGAAAFRLIDREHPTMIVDEADDIFQRKRDLVHIINASWTRGTRIPRSLPGQAGIHWYDVFCPKIIGLKGMKIPGTTASRFITIRMLPRLPEETIEDFSFVDSPEFVEIRRKLARWAADNAVVLGDARPEQPPRFHNRLASNWKLLFAIADLAGADWAKRARQAAIKLSQQQAEPSQGRRLLAAVSEIIANRDVISSEELVKQLAGDPIAEWCEFGRGRTPITQRQLAVLLKDFEIFPKVIHPTKRADDSPRGYRRSDFADAFARFLPRDPHIRTQPPRPKRK